MKYGAIFFEALTHPPTPPPPEWGKVFVWWKMSYICLV